MIHGWANSLKALRLALVGIIAVIVFSLTLGQFGFATLYASNYQFLPGHWFARHLNIAKQEPSKTCILIGASVVREGFDNSVLAKTVPGIRFVNLATTAGYVVADTIEVQAAILSQYPERYECVILGLNSFYINRLADGAYDILPTDYVSQMRPQTLLSLTGFAEFHPSVAELAYKFGMPFAKHSLMAQRALRERLFRVHQLLINSETPVRTFELFPGEFSPAIQYRYDRPSIYAEARKKAEQLLPKNGMEQANSYRDPLAQATLKRAVTLLSDLTDKLILVEMPLTSVYQKAETLARPNFYETLRDVPMELFLRCSFSPSVEAAWFYDSSHLAANGRRLLSQSVGEILSGEKSTELCQTVDLASGASS
ncbi:hypothetical protein ABFT80_23820 [Mesorhizobium sp. SB112]|uniref:hypothetical protein n=1 Tax=Mesorhizobium sp. SB112 TaxID=3151853 RepID=UPI00326434DD